MCNANMYKEKKQLIFYCPSKPILREIGLADQRA